MQEMLAPTSALIGQGLGESVGLITDGRFSAGRGAWWSVTSRRRRTSAAHRAGQEGDSITIDAHKLLIQLNVRTTSSRGGAPLEGAGAALHARPAREVHAPRVDREPAARSPTRPE
jgi:dihydroxyacid dehydratase/phosphogluconate dehydratase